MDNELVDLLAKGDKRTVENVDKALRMLEADPELLATILVCMSDKSDGLAMRAADCLEKFSRRHAKLLQPHIKRLIAILQSMPQKEVRWHLAQILPRLPLSEEDLHDATVIWIKDFYEHSSSIVRAASLQAVFDVAVTSEEAEKVRGDMITFALQNGTPAMQARARRLVQGS